MKKLLFTAIAAAGVAFGLRAADAGFLAGTDFEDSAVPSTGWTIPEDDPNQSLVNTANTDRYEKDVPAKWLDSDHNKFLAVKTTFGKPISLDLATAQSMSAGAYFDSLVKMTVCDEAPAADTYAGAKIMVWAQENTDGTATSLWVRASAPDGESWKSQDFQCAGKFDKADAWHRLTIKAIPDIFKAEGQLDYVPGFVVYVDGAAVQCESAHLTATGLNDNAAAFNDKNSLFVSLVQGSADGKDAISAVAFDGQGSLDDVTLTSAAPDFAKDFEFFTIEMGTDVTGFTYQVNSDTAVQATANVQLPYAAGMVVTISDVTCADGKMFKDLTADTGVTVGSDTFTVAAPNLHGVINAQDAAATFNGKSYATIADAIKDANEIDVAGEYTLKLWNNVEEGEQIVFENETAGVNVTLDLAGKNIADGLKWEASGTLTITNTTENIGTVAAGESEKAVTGSGEKIIITAGQYDGEVSFDNLTAAEIWGGKIQVSTNTKDALVEYVKPEGYTLVEDNGYYVVSEAPKGTVIFMVNGEQYDTQTVPVGECVTKPEDPAPAKTWQKFVEWQKDGVAFDFTAPLAAAGEITLTATFALNLTQDENNDYQIKEADDLNTLAAYVNDGNNAEGMTFVQTADIPWTADDGEFAGVGVYTVKAEGTAPFKGTYDGQNHKIKDIIFAKAKYAGVIVQLCGGTLKNLTVENASFKGDLSGEAGGAMAVGHLFGGTVQNVTTTGSFGSPDKPNTATAAGIVCRAQFGTIEDCTNNAALSATGEKVAGILGINQNAEAGQSVSITRCVNTGAMNKPGMYGSTTGVFVGGMIAYCETDVTLTDCSNTGVITLGDGVKGSALAELIGVAKKSITVTATGCSGTINRPAVGNKDAGVTITGLACGVKNDDVVNYTDTLAKDTTFIVARSSFAPTFELQAVDDTIAFDQSLKTVDNFDGITVVDGLAIETNVVEKVTTFKAISAGSTDWPKNPEDVAGKTAGEAFGLTGELANADAVKVAAWAKAKNVAFGDKANINAEAMLLNIANDGNVEEAKAAFKFSAEDLAALMADPEAATSLATKYPYAQLTIGKFSDAACTTEWKTGDSQEFFKATLTVPQASVK